MNPTSRAVLGAMLAIGQMPAVAFAHSLDSLQGQLFDKEKFFQIQNEPAPEDAEGRRIALADLRGGDRICAVPRRPAGTFSEPSARSATARGLVPLTRTGPKAGLKGQRDVRSRRCLQFYQSGIVWFS